jgi:hypothetical protein
MREGADHFLLGRVGLQGYYVLFCLLIAEGRFCVVRSAVDR